MHKTLIVISSLFFSVSAFSYTIENNSNLSYDYISPTTSGTLMPNQQVELHDMGENKNLIIRPEGGGDHEFVLSQNFPTSVVLTAINKNIVKKHKGGDDEQRQSSDAKYPPTPGEAYVIVGDMNDPAIGIEVDRSYIRIYPNRYVNAYFYNLINPSSNANTATNITPPNFP